MQAAIRVAALLSCLYYTLLIRRSWRKVFVADRVFRTHVLLSSTCLNGKGSMQEESRLQTQHRPKHTVILTVIGRTYRNLSLMGSKGFLITGQL